MFAPPRGVCSLFKSGCSDDSELTSRGITRGAVAFGSAPHHEHMSRKTIQLFKSILPAVLLVLLSVGGVKAAMHISSERLERLKLELSSEKVQPPTPELIDDKWYEANGYIYCGAKPTGYWTLEVAGCDVVTFPVQNPQKKSTAAQEEATPTRKCYAPDGTEVAPEKCAVLWANQGMATGGKVDCYTKYGIEKLTAQACADAKNFDAKSEADWNAYLKSMEEANQRAKELEAQFQEINNRTYQPASLPNSVVLEPMPSIGESVPIIDPTCVSHDGTTICR